MSSLHSSNMSRTNSVEIPDERKNSDSLSVASPILIHNPANNVCRLNVSGRPYRIRPELVLAHQDQSLLGRFVIAGHEERMQTADRFLPATNEYYFERNSKLVDYIIDYYISGQLHRPTDVCMERFREELAFWGLNPQQISLCCADKSETDKQCLPLLPASHDEEGVDFDQMCCATLRRRLYGVLEKPNSSRSAQLFAGLSVFFVFTSVVGLVLGSMPEFQADGRNATLYHSNPRFESTGKFFHQQQLQHQQMPDAKNINAVAGVNDFVYQPTDNPSVALVYVEYVCIGWFTFEYVMRFIIAPNKRQFTTKALNLIDLFTILPFYMETFLPLVGINADKLQRVTGAMLVIRVLRVLRMARVFKLARYSRGLQIFGNTLHSSVAELSMLGMFLLTGIIFFSTIMYFLEKDEVNSDFTSIPAACWWCVVTMTTIGYGDSLPQTAVGKLVATSASICGIIVLAFPISMIVEKFATAQQRSMVDVEPEKDEVATGSYTLNRLQKRRSTGNNVLHQQL